MASESSRSRKCENLPEKRLQPKVVSKQCGGGVRKKSCMKRKALIRAGNLGRGHSQAGTDLFVYRCTMKNRDDRIDRVVLARHTMRIQMMLCSRMTRITIVL